MLWQFTFSAIKVCFVARSQCISLSNIHTTSYRKNAELTLNLVLFARSVDRVRESSWHSVIDYLLRLLYQSFVETLVYEVITLLGDPVAVLKISIH